MVQVGDKSPWGRIQGVHVISEGITAVTTAGHGGIKLSRARNALMPPCLRLAGGWYEEDAEFARVVVNFTASFDDAYVEAARRNLRDYNPDAYEAFTHVKIKPGESRLRDQAAFKEQHANDLVAISAFGDWHSTVPKGKVGVVCTVGGVRGLPEGSERFFLVPEDEYQARGRFGFVVADPTQYQELATLA